MFEVDIKFADGNRITVVSTIDPALVDGFLLLTCKSNTIYAYNKNTIDSFFIDEVKG